MTSISQASSPLSRSIGFSRPFQVSSDLEAVADLVELCFADTLDESGRSYLRRMRQAARHQSFLRWASAAADWASLPFSGFVWQDGDRVVGNVSLIPFSVSTTRRYLIANVAVHPDYRRMGIARQLTLQALERARQRRVTSIWLHVREENLAAISLYRSLGFVERTRRTTWFSTARDSSAVATSGLAIRKPRPGDWKVYSEWLYRTYPDEFTWHLNFDKNELQPGWRGAFLCLWRGLQVRHWAAVLNGELLAVASWRHSLRHENTVWLAADEHAGEVTIVALLDRVRMTMKPRRLSMEYPAGHFDTAIERAGFRAYHTLIWMERHLH